MKIFHRYLLNKLLLYKKWREHSHHSHVHWGVLGSVALGVALAFVGLGWNGFDSFEADVVGAQAASPDWMTQFTNGFDVGAPTGIMREYTHASSGCGRNLFEDWNISGFGTSGKTHRADAFLAPCAANPLRYYPSYDAIPTAQFPMPALIMFWMKVEAPNWQTVGSSRFSQLTVKGGPDIANSPLEKIVTTHIDGGGRMDCGHCTMLYQSTRAVPLGRPNDGDPKDGWHLQSAYLENVNGVTHAYFWVNEWFAVHGTVDNLFNRYLPQGAIVSIHAGLYADRNSPNTLFSVWNDDMKIFTVSNLDEARVIIESELPGNAQVGAPPGGGPLPTPSPSQSPSPTPTPTPTPPPPPSTVCGNNIKEGTEQCDGLSGQSCVSLGFSAGSIGCTRECNLDTSQCPGNVSSPPPPPPGPVSGWDHDYPRIATQSFMNAPAEWYARFDLNIFKEDRATLNRIRQLNSSAKMIYTEGISAYHSSLETVCGSLNEQYFVMRDDGVTHAGTLGRNQEFMNLSNLDQASVSVRYNEFIPRCLTNKAVSEGYDGVGTDWLWDKPRVQDDNMDMDRNGVNDYVQFGGASGVESEWSKGVGTLVSNWRAMIDGKTWFGNTSGQNVPLWLNTGKLHGNTEVPGALSLSNGLEFEREWGFTNFANAWNRYQSWINSGRKPSVWMTDVYPGLSDYTNYMNAKGYTRGAHTKNYLEIMRMYLAFTMMGNGYLEFNPRECGEHHCFAYFDEFDLSLGQPLASGGPHTLSPGVMVRFFDRGAVIMNANSSPVSVLDSQLRALSGYTGPYYRFLGGQDVALNGSRAINNGQQFTSITLDGHDASGHAVGDGILLVKSPTTVVSDIVIDNTEHFTSPGSEAVVVAPSAQWVQSRTQDGSWSPENVSTSRGTYAYDSTTSVAATATFTPSVGVAGNYEVFEWHGTCPGCGATNVKHEIKHTDGVITKTVDQSARVGQWNSLGTFQFNAGVSGYVKILTEGASATVIGDAIMFKYVGQ